jgi:hypothetical protein
MTPAERFTTWRQEVADEIQALEAELAAARTAAEAAEAAHASAFDSWKALDEFAASAAPSGQGMAGALYGRLQSARDEILTGAQSDRGGARAALEALEKRIETLRDAISQIDRALTAAKVTHLKVPTEAPRHKAPPVEFDTIQMPRAISQSERR